MSVHTKKAETREFHGVMADAQLADIVEKMQEELDYRGDALVALEIVTSIAERKITAPADIQATYVAEQAKKGFRRPTKDEKPSEETGQFPEGSKIDGNMISFAELPEETQRRHTAVFNFVKAELAAAGRLGT